MLCTSCLYCGPPAIFIFMFYLPIHTMLVVKFVVGLGKRVLHFYVHCLSSRLRIGDKSEAGRP